VELDAYSAPQCFDAVIGRFILLYLPNPAATLRQLRSCLRPGGIMAFQEFEMPHLSAAPRSKLLMQVKQWILQAFVAAAVDLSMGSNVLRTFLAAGPPRPTMLGASRVESGPQSPAHEYISHTVRSLLPLIEHAGIASSTEIDIESLAQRLWEDTVANERVIFFP
jgi:hypothetical protein